LAPQPSTASQQVIHRHTGSMVGETLWFATSGTGGTLSSDLAGSLLVVDDSPRSLGSVGAAQATAESVIATTPRNIEIFIMVDHLHRAIRLGASLGAAGVPVLMQAHFLSKRDSLRAAARHLLSA
jgi:hypothetical protein